jgi:hypothetical protein
VSQRTLFFEHLNSEIVTLQELNSVLERAQCIMDMDNLIDEMYLPVERLYTTLTRFAMHISKNIIFVFVNILRNIQDVFMIKYVFVLTLRIISQSLILFMPCLYSRNETFKNLHILSDKVHIYKFTKFDLLNLHDMIFHFCFLNYYTVSMVFLFHARN